MAADDDNTLTLRAPRGAVAVVVAALAHLSALWIIEQLPVPKKPEERIEMTVASKPPPPPPPSSSTEPPPPPKKRKPPKQAPPTTPVAPVLPASPAPPENRAILPDVPVSPEPAPPPPSNWKESLLSSLAETTPSTRAPTGVLAPSFRTLQTVANNDPRMHDDTAEARIAENYGPFFRRGIEALRRTWHPEDPLLSPEVRQRCQTTLRTTQAVATLDREGNIVDVEVKRSSGCPELDAEAVNAWRKVGQLPHPPRGLFVLPDGTPTDTARMPVRFIVSFDGGLRLDYN